MNNIKVIKNVGGILGLCIIEPTLHQDTRGYFFESYNREEMLEQGLDFEFVQDNQSLSYKGVLRGLHVNINHPQGKLIRVVNGCIYDVAVDLRKKSRTYGKWFGIELSSENRKQMYLPMGFAHGFLALRDDSEVCFKVTAHWQQNDEVGIAWNDPDIGIKWPEGVDIILSDKDYLNKTIAELKF